MRNSQRATQTVWKPGGHGSPLPAPPLHQWCSTSAPVVLPFLPSFFTLGLWLHRLGHYTSPLPSPVPVRFLLLWLIKHWPKPSQGRKVYLAYCYSSSVREVSRIWRQALEQRPWRSTVPWAASSASLSGVGGEAGALLPSEPNPAFYGGPVLTLSQDSGQSSTVL